MIGQSGRPGASPWWTIFTGQRLCRQAAALAAILAVMAGPAARAAITPRYGQKLVIAARGPVTTLDPARAASPAERELVAQLFEGLTRPGPAGPRPAVAEAWSASPDGRNWTFHLRKGPTFSDNHPVDAGAFVDSWERARTLAPDRVPWLAGARLVARDPSTFQVTLTNQADVPLLALDPIMSAVRVVASPDGESLAGSGPFRFGGTKDGAFVLAPRLGHWAGRPFAGQLRVYPLDSTAEIERLGNSIDLLHGFPPGRDSGLVSFSMPAPLSGVAGVEPAGGRAGLAGTVINPAAGTVDLSGAWRNP